MTFKTLDDADLSGKRALVRVDLNVPMEDGQVTDDTRLQAAKPTVDKLRAGGAKVILLAHFGLSVDDVLAEFRRREGVSGIDEKKSRTAG